MSNYTIHEDHAPALYNLRLEGPTCPFCANPIKGQWLSDGGPAWFDMEDPATTVGATDGSFAHAACLAADAASQMAPEHRETLATVYRLCQALTNELSVEAMTAFEAAFPFLPIRSLDALVSEIQDVISGGLDYEPKWIAGAEDEAKARELRSAENHRDQYHAWQRMTVFAGGVQ